METLRIRTPARRARIRPGDPGWCGRISGVSPGPRGGRTGPATGTGRGPLSQIDLLRETLPPQLPDSSGQEDCHVTNPGTDPQMSQMTQMDREEGPGRES